MSSGYAYGYGEVEDVRRRVLGILQSLGVNDVRIVVSDYFPGIAAVPWFKTIMVSRPVASALSDEHLKAILAHESYHLSMLKDKFRLVRNVLTSMAGYLMLIDIILGVAAAINYLSDRVGLSGRSFGDAVTAFLIGLAVVLLIAPASVLVRKIESKLMRWVPFGAEEAEANAYASSIVGHSTFLDSILAYTLAVRSLVGGGGFTGVLFKNTLQISEAMNPHPREGEGEDGGEG